MNHVRFKISFQMWTVIALAVCLFVVPGALRAAVCVDAACVQVSGRLATIDTKRSYLLNALTGRLLNTTVAVADWQALADANVNLLDILKVVQTDLNLGTPKDAFEANLTLAEVYSATATALTAKGQTAAANGLNTLSAAAGLGSIRLLDLLDLCSSCSDYADVNLNVLDFVGASAQLFNYNYALITPTPVTLSGVNIGDSGLGTIKLYAQICEPPRIACGPNGTQFYGATIRLKLDMDLVSVDLTSLLSSLGVGSLHAQLTHLTLYATIAKAEGMIQTVNALAGTVDVQAKPGLVDLYLGEMDDTQFFSKSHIINPAADLSPCKLGAMQVTLLGTNITQEIRVKAWAEGDAPFNSSLHFSGPYPQTKTVSSSLNFVTNLLSTLVNNLEITYVLTTPGFLGPTVTTALNSLIGLLTPVLKLAVNGVVTPVLGSVITNVLDPLLMLLGIRIGQADITVLGAHKKCTYTVSGNVYRDLNRNGFKDSAETGTGLALYAKLVSASTPSGPASQAVVVNSTTGAYSFSGVAKGSYLVVLSANNTLSDVTPVAVPAGWTITEQSTRSRAIVVASDLPDQNFGYAPFSAVSGRVFKDTGSTGGTANDGIRNGAEAGLGGVTMQVLDGSNTVLDTTTTAGDGTYTLYLPSTVTNGTALRIVETNPTDQVSTGASVGNTGGTYTRATDTVAFTYSAGTAYTGVDFADVPAPQFSTDGQQSTVPASTVFYPHRFTAGTLGQVSFALSHTLTPVVDGWTETVYLDVNGNGTVDPSESPISGPITVTPGQAVDVVVKVFAPATAPNAARDQSTLTATFTYTNASPALSATLTRTDLTTISGGSTAGLKLVKAVDKASALPGATLVYTITFTNESPGVLRTVVVYDETPAYTHFVSAATTSLPTGFTVDTLTKPANGGTGPIKWTFAGELASGATGTVTFSVTVDQ